MKIKCEWCSSYIQDTDERVPVGQGTGWDMQDTADVPMDLRQHYKNYGIGWTDAELADGVEDFRSTDTYRMPNGYYDIGGYTYYNYYNDWFLYDGDDYTDCEEPYDAWEYEDGLYYTPRYDGMDFYESDYYDSNYNTSYDSWDYGQDNSDQDDSYYDSNYNTSYDYDSGYSSWDYDYDWDSGWDDDYGSYDYSGWDSYDTDWDSDW